MRFLGVAPRLVLRYCLVGFVGDTIECRICCEADVIAVGLTPVVCPGYKLCDDSSVDGRWDFSVLQKKHGELLVVLFCGGATEVVEIFKG